MQMHYKQVLELSESGRKTLYLVLDCETATMPFANEITLDPVQKRKIAIARPLIYDIGWAIVDADLNVYMRKSFLVSEIFAVPAVFNTAYYKEKRPIYTARLRNGETTLLPWENIAQELLNDLHFADYTCAFNAMFDFKKAITFTEIYIKQVYGNNYQNWENMQRQVCTSIARGSKSKGSNEFDKDNFIFRDEKFPMIDIWGVACSCLINTQTFKRECLENEMISESGRYFKTSAEATYRYLVSKYEFEEAHTAIDDVDIECFILHKALKKGKVPKGIVYFPFQQLGTTTEYLTRTKRLKEKHLVLTIKTMERKLESYGDRRSGYATTLENESARLRHIRDLRF